MRRRNATLLAVTALLALSARAQIAQVAAPAPLEVTLAYGADRTDGVVGGCGCFWMAGGKAEANANLGRGLSAVAELAGSHVSNINSAHEGPDPGFVSLRTALQLPRIEKVCAVCPDSYWRCARLRFAVSGSEWDSSKPGCLCLRRWGRT